MIFTEMPIPGAFLVQPDHLEDARGFFARTYCQEEFSWHGLDSRLVQCNISFNRHRGTLRGMHYQAAPYPEAKLVRCTQGAIYDVILDLRPHSPVFGRWCSTELSAQNRYALYIPPGVAHGFQTREDHTEVFYQMSEFYHPEVASGVRWNDPAFGIEWPISDPVLSARDEAYADFEEAHHHG